MPKQTIAQQKKLKARIERRDNLPLGGWRKLETVAGLDVPFKNSGKVTCGVVKFHLPGPVRLADKMSKMG